jgi:RNA polymerase sigma-70 factor (ECF subfamily)
LDEINPAEAEDRALLERLRHGDPGAAAAVMQRHNRALWRIARGILRDEADAEEVVQEAYLRTFSSSGGFRGEVSLSTWLARIVINEALRRLGRRRATLDLSAVDKRGAGEPGTLHLLLAEQRRPCQPRRHQ